MHSIDLKNYDIRTDLIIETIDKKTLPKTILFDSYKENNILVEKMSLSKENSNTTNKKEGDYITISFEDITDSGNRKQVEDTLVKELSQLLKKMNINDTDSALVIGLGNNSSTPDALGPKVLNNILVTRHLMLVNEQIEEGYRITSKLTPDVTGNTGIETENVIKGVINNTNPKFIIIVDALKASNINRVNTTIQMTNTGISPGSGIGNKRVELSKETLSVPVISIGVPTIVDVVAIVNDTINFLIKKFAYSKNTLNKNSNKLKINDNYMKENNLNLKNEEKEKLLGLVGTLNDEDKKELIYEVVNPIGYNLMVTPKEIDFVLEKLAITISKAINRTLHKNYK